MIRIVIGLFAIALAAVPAWPADVDALIRQIAKSDFDQDREAQFALSALVAKAHSSPVEMRGLEKRLIAGLKGATPAGKDFLCRQLSLIGSEASVPVLSAMLLDPKTADTARYALHRIPGPEVDRALRSALSRTAGITRIGIINTLGRRRDAAAAPSLRRLAMGTDTATAAAAASALAEIGNPAAAQALLDALGNAGSPSHLAIAEAALKAADRLRAQGNSAAALPLYKKLYAAGEPLVVRAGALRGLGAAGGVQFKPVLLEALRDNNSGLLQNAAIDTLLETSPGELVSGMAKLGEAGQARVLAALGGRGDASALPAFTAAMKSPSKPVRVAALEGAGRVGNAALVPVLAAAAAAGEPEEQAAARASLVRLRGEDVDRALVEAMTASGEPKVRLELIRAAGERGLSAAAPALLSMARDAGPEVRRESLRALRESASAKDIPGLLELVLRPAQSGDRAEAARSVAAVLRRSDASRFSDVLSAFANAGDTESRTALMQVMGQSGNHTALLLLRGSLREEDANLKRAAILALSDWPDATPVPDLLDAARTASNPAHQVLALRGAVRLIGLPGASRAPRESVKLLAEAMSLARQADEKRSILALLPRFPTREALELARASLNDAEVAAESKAAVARLERTVRR